MREKSTRSLLPLALVVFVLSAAALFVTKGLELSRFFAGTTPLVSLANQPASTGTVLATFPVAKGDFYLVRLRSTAKQTIVLAPLSGNEAVSKPEVFDPRPDGDLHLYTTAFKADFDDPAGTLRLESAPGKPAQQIEIKEFSVLPFSGAFYNIRYLLRYTGLAGFILAGVYLLWQLIRALVPAPRPEPANPAVLIPGSEAGELPQPSPGFWSVRLVAAWAVFFLILAGSFDFYYVRRQHSHLLLKPPLPSITGWDGSFYYFWLRTVMVGGDLDLADDILYTDALPEETRYVEAYTIHSEKYPNLPRTKLGLIPDKYPIGWALLEVPWYVAGDLYAQWRNARGDKLLYDGWSPVYQIALVTGQVAYALAGLFFAYQILRRYLPAAAAVCAVAAGWLASPLCYYQTLDIAMSHNVLFFATMAAYYFTLRLREAGGGLLTWFLVGASCAFVILSRYQGAVLLVFPVVVCLQVLFRDWRQWQGLLLGLLGGAIPLGIQVLAWKLMYGTYLLYTYEGEAFYWTQPHLYDVLFSSWHGWFNWHPAMFLGIAGFLVWVVTTPYRTEAICFTLSLLLVWYVNASWSSWWFGAAFGARAFESCTLFAMIGLGFWFVRLAEHRLALNSLMLVLLLLGLWNMNLLSLTLQGRLDFGGPVTWQTKLELSYQMWRKSFHHL